MPNFENAFNTVCELVKDFKENEHRYLSPQYQEAEVRRDYIDKLFEALGWDVYHRTQKNPYEQEVKVEKGVSVGKAQKRADYAFYINPEYRQPKFFCEAKKPCRSLKNADDYFQTIRYGWNSNTPVAVLTDFEEFHILDCRYKPNINQVLFNPNHKAYRYTDFTDPEKFKEIYYLFSRNDVANNSLEKYSEAFAKIKGKQKTAFKSTIQAIDDDFLEYIDEVRETLAKAFKKNDSKLSSEELTEATQRTIDRIVFIRFLEDKLIEPEYYISEFGKKGNAWNEFILVCRKLDAKYNGIVFKKHFIDEQNFQGPEQSTFKKICDEMSYLNSPYDFNAIPIHILGSIYERFLGKVVNATAQRVKVEEKPEVRKAGGVYYTPKYIVDYIVDNTVGKILRNEESSGGTTAYEKDKSNNLEDCLTFPSGKTPAQISKLRFADIACGSGSFLIGVFETLLKYHTEYYQLHPEEAKKDGCINKEGQWILSIKQKQNILLNNIYGVDIDNQAVEVTQLSLALKMLEDESTATANEMQVLFHEKILPDLSKNIVCGNSLIGTDILQGKMFPTEEERKLNPMDFETMFPGVFKQGGFDAIVGNPPYVNLVSIPEIDRKYFQKHYKTCKNKSDLYSFFLEKALSLLKSNKFRLGYITPHTWIATESFELLRRLLINNKYLNIISDMGFNVFKDAIVSTVVVICSEGNEKITINNKDYSFKFQLDFQNLINDNYYIDLDWSLEKEKVYNRLKEGTIPLEKIIRFSRGIKTSNDNKYLSIKPINDEYKKIYRGKNIKSYQLNWEGEYVWYRPDLMREKAGCLPHTKEFFEVEEKLITQRVNSSMQLLVAYDNQKQYFLDTTNVSRYESWDKIHSFKYILALLNSSLINYWYCNKYKMPTIGGYELHSIPFHTLDFQNLSDKQSHDRIVSLVNEMLEAKKQLQTIKTDRDKTYWERKCEQIDNAIDSEVYKLYGLTDEEIKIVEG